LPGENLFGGRNAVAFVRQRASAAAIMPGTMTRNGKNIFGTAATSGVLARGGHFFAACARWTTRKFVHQ